MPGSSTNSLGNVIGCYLLYANLLPPATVTTNSSNTSTYTINGLVIGDAIDLYPQSTLATSTTYLTIGGAWVSAANTLSVQWVNSTSASSSGSPTAIPFVLQATRADNAGFGYKNLPQGLE